jgi:hypothetical protein
VFSAWLAPCALAQTPEPDAKSIPKAILMLGLYCNAANIVLKPFYERAPLAPPWRAQGKRADAFQKVFSGLDFQYWGNAKAIKDKALSEREVTYLILTAQKEAKIWGEHATPQCGFLQEADEIEVCLRNLNSEVYKCFQQLDSQVKVLSRAP